MPRTTTIIAGALLLTGAAPAQDEPREAPVAQPPPVAAPPPTSRPPQDRVAVSLSGGFNLGLGADMDDATGDVSVSRVGAGVDVSFLLQERSRLTLSVSEELSFYDFSTTSLLGGPEPIDDASELRLGVGASHQFDDRWSGLVATTGSFSGEAGADFGDSFTFGGVALANYKVSKSLSLGAGVLARSVLEDDAFVVPIALIDWSITEDLRLSTGGDTEGARATLEYALSDEWSLTGDVGYEARGFRLDEANLGAPSGVFRDRSLPVGLGIVHEPSPRLRFHLRGGVRFLHSLEIDNAAGSELADTDVDPSGFIGFEFSVRL